MVYIGVLTGEDSDSIELDAPFSRFDLDSVDVVEMASQFEKAFDCEVGAGVFPPERAEPPRNGPEARRDRGRKAKS